MTAETNTLSPATERPAIFDRLSALADPTRCRLLLALEAHELTVSELCTVLQLPQSTISRHLKTLADDGWITGRRDGTSRKYSSVREAKGERSQRLWQLLREEVATGPAAEHDRARLEQVMLERRSRSQEFFTSAAGRWAQLREEMFGRRFDLVALLALLEDNSIIGDLGCGTGQTSASLAAFVGRVIAVDESPAMLAAAKERLSAAGNVELRRGRLESLPIEDGVLDAAVLGLVLHHVPDPQQALTEAGRVLRGGGKLLIVDMLPHEREEYRQEMGHLWLGFHEGQLETWLSQAGFGRAVIHRLPPEPQAKGPNLFVATAKREAS